MHPEGMSDGSRWSFQPALRSASDEGGGRGENDHRETGREKRCTREGCQIHRFTRGRDDGSSYKLFAGNFDNPRLSLKSISDKTEVNSGHLHIDTLTARPYLLGDQTQTGRELHDCNVTAAKL